MSKTSKQRNKLKKLIKKGQNDMPTITEHIQKETGLKGRWEPVVDMFCPKCKEIEYCYLFDDDKTGYCMACGKEFDIADVLDSASASDLTGEYDVEFTEEDGNTSGVYLSKEFGDANSEAGKQINKSTPTQTTIKGFGPSNTGWTQHQGWTNQCTHEPQHVINGRNYEIWAGKKTDCISHLNKFDVVLNLTFSSVKEKHNIPIPELKKYESINGKFTEIQLDWPDYGITGLPRQFWIDLLNYLDENKFKMVVFCLGGHGRTGTAIASMLVVLGYEPLTAIKWVRENYCDEAIESASQEQYIKMMALQVPRVKEEEKQIEIAK
jgi:protein-tyrosine phosphatase